MYDLAIIGGGPAGVAAGVYAARKRLKTIFITKDFLSQSTVSPDIQNWIGTSSIPGLQLAKNFEEHLRAYAEDVVDIHTGEYAHTVTGEAGDFTITTDKGSYAAKTILITTGSSRRRLDVPGADKFEHKGVTYCASCDGPLFAGMDVIIVGGGNAAFETAAQLLAYSKSVTLLNRSAEFKADPVTVDSVLSDPKMNAIKNAVLKSVEGDKFVTGVTYTDNITEETVSLPASGVFAEIGSIPNTDFVKNIVELDEFNTIKVDPRTQETSKEGIWAAGDCTDGLYHQNNIAAGDGIKALEDIYLYVKVHAK